MNRPSFQAPPPPDLPTPVLDAPPLDERDAGARLALWAGLLLILLAGWQLPPLVAALLTWWPADGGWVLLYEALGIAVGLGTGVVWLVQPLRAELAAARRRAELWQLQADAYSRAQAVARLSRRAYDRRWSTAPPAERAAPAEPVIIDGRAHVMARAAAWSAPPPREHITQHLPALPAAGGQLLYYGSDLERVCAALLAGQVVSVRQPAAGLEPAASQDALRALLQAGILIRRLGRPVTFAADLATDKTPREIAHRRIAARLGALPYQDECA